MGKKIDKDKCKYRLSTVERAEKQVVAGTMYHLTADFRLAEGGLGDCAAVVACRSVRVLKALPSDCSSGNEDGEKCMRVGY